MHMIDMSTAIATLKEFGFYGEGSNDRTASQAFFGTAPCKSAPCGRSPNSGLIAYCKNNGIDMDAHKDPNNKTITEVLLDAFIYVKMGA